MKKAFVKQVAVGITVLALWEMVARPAFNMLFNKGT